jgi:hypothetical protein
MDELSRLKWTAFARNVVLLTLAVIGGYWIGGDKYRFEWAPMDTIATGGFILLLSWLLLPDFRLDDGHFNEATESLALRWGKAAKRTLRRLQRLLGSARSD